MNERELLEFAAKAAGLTDAVWEDVSGWGEVRHGFSGAMWSAALNEQTGTGYWNPLHNDGDAFRLMVEIAKRHQFFALLLSGVGPFAKTERGLSVIVEHSDDHAFATRRAIVRVAAEIGMAGA